MHTALLQSPAGAASHSTSTSSATYLSLLAQHAHDDSALSLLAVHTEERRLESPRLLFQGSHHQNIKMYVLQGEAYDP